MTSYQLNVAAFRELVLNSEFMEAEMRERAERGAEFARSIAPVDPASPDPGRYRDSIEVSSGKHGGVNGDRAYGMVSTNAPADNARTSLSVFVEYGTEHNEAHHVMTRTLDVLGG